MYPSQSSPYLTLLVNALLRRLGPDLNRSLMQVEQSVPPSEWHEVKLYTMGADGIDAQGS
jgi:hypothetical protein